MQPTLCSATPAKFVVIKVPALAAGTVSRARTIARTLGLEFFESTQPGMPCSISMPPNLADLDLLTEQLQAAELSFTFSPLNISLIGLHPAVLACTRFFDTGRNFDYCGHMEPAALERMSFLTVSSTSV